MKELLAFTRMIGGLFKAIINCGTHVITAIDCGCFGAGAIIAMASGLRIAMAGITQPAWQVTDEKEHLARQREVGEAYRRVLGRHFSAMTMVVVADRIEDDALVEIEATAVISTSGSG